MKKTFSQYNRYFCIFGELEENWFFPVISVSKTLTDILIVTKEWD